MCSPTYALDIRTTPCIKLDAYPVMGSDWSGCHQVCNTSSNGGYGLLFLVWCLGKELSLDTKVGCYNTKTCMGGNGVIEYLAKECSR